MRRHREVTLSNITYAYHSCMINFLLINFIQQLNVIEKNKISDQRNEKCFRELTVITKLWTDGRKKVLSINNNNNNNNINNKLKNNNSNNSISVPFPLLGSRQHTQWPIISAEMVRAESVYSSLKCQALLQTTRALPSVRARRSFFS